MATLTPPSAPVQRTARAFPVPTPVRRRRSSIGRGLALAAVGTLVGALAAELALSTRESFRPWPRYAPGERANELALSSFLQPEPVTGWSMRPSFTYVHGEPEYVVSYRSNAEGFRSDRPLADATGGILLVGDSYTFGIGVEREETYGALVEQAVRIPIANLAMPGFALDQMVLQVEHALPLVQPRLVVVGLCDADLARSQSAFSIPNGLNKPAFRLADDGALHLRTAADRLPEPLHFLEHRSHLWMAARQALRVLGYRYPVGEWWSLNAALLERLRRDCAEAGVPLVLVYVPTPECRPFPTLASWAARTHVPLVDLAETMRGRDGLFFPADRHFTPAGHAHAARELLELVGPRLRRPLVSRSR